MTGITAYRDPSSIPGHTETETLRAHGVPPPPQGNTVSSDTSRLPGGPPPPSSGPTNGAAETTATAPKPGYADVTNEVNARLAAHEDFQRLSADLTKSESLLNDVQTLVNLKIPGRPGETALSMDNIRAVANDPFRTPAERDAAQRLLNNPDLLAQFMKGDDKMSIADVREVIAGLRTQKNEIKNQITAEVKDELGIGKPPATQENPATGTTPNPGTGETDGGATPQPAPGSDIPKPPPSTKPGMDGALENLGNSADYLQKKMEAVANDPNMEPGLKASTMASLQAQQTSVMNMLNQLSQMMSNTAKLWSDIAMNSVRNIK